MPVCAFCLGGGHRDAVPGGFPRGAAQPRPGNGSYRAYATEDREDSSTVTLVLGRAPSMACRLRCTCPAHATSGMVQRAAQAVSAGSTGHAFAIA